MRKCSRPTTSGGYWTPIAHDCFITLKVTTSAVVLWWRTDGTWNEPLTGITMLEYPQRVELEVANGIGTTLAFLHSQFVLRKE